MRLFLPVLLLLVMTSCQQSLPDMLCSQAWKFDGFDISAELEEKLGGAVNSSTRAKLRQILKNGSSKTETIWRFYPDNSCAILSNGHYSVGRWELGRKTEILTITSVDTREVYRVEAKDKELMLWQLGSKGDETGQIAATLQPSDEYQNGDMDLLAPSRNTWRIKPAHPEMFQDIKKRLTNQLAYMIDYFEMIEKKEQGYFSIPHLNAPFQFYSGGMGLLNFNELPSEWVGQFYNTGDALVAHVLLSGAFDSDITFPSSKKSFSGAYARFLKQMKVFVIAQEEPETLPVQ